MDITTDIFLQFLAIILILFFIIVIAMKFIMNVYIPFLDEREYIQMEIARNGGSERQHWERELRRLYIGSIPIIGKHINRRERRRRRK